MHKTNLVFLLFVSILAFSLYGCSPIEDKISQNFLDDNSLPQPLTAIDWTNKVNSLLLPLLNTGETFLAHYLDITKGEYSIETEIAMVEMSLNKVQKTIEEINNLYPPSGYIQHKQEVLKRLNAYKNVLQQYYDALQSKDTKRIESVIEMLKDELASLKTVFRVL